MFLVLLMYALFASVFTVGKIGLEVSQPFFLTGVRMLAAGLVLLGWQSIVSPASCRAPVKLWPLLLLVAIFNVFITNAFEFWGLQYMLSSKTCLLYSLSPFAAVFLSYLFLGEMMTPMKWLGLTVGIAGFIPLFLGPWWNGHEPSSVMESWAEAALTVSAITAVIGWIFVKKLTVQYGYPGVMVNAVSFILGALFCFIVSLATESWTPFPVADWSLFWLSVAYIALIHNIICYNIYAYSLKNFSVTFMAFAGLSNPLFTAFYGWYFLDEPLTGSFFIAIIGAASGLGIFYREEKLKTVPLAGISSAILLCVFLSGCGQPSEAKSHWEVIEDRNLRPFYRAEVPEEWTRLPSSGPLHDTTLPVASWEHDGIKITVHTFPADTLESRISPAMQVKRWLKQIRGIDEDSVIISECGGGGYLGLMVEASGEETGLIAISMQLAPQHFQVMSNIAPDDYHARADYTIKAAGPKTAINRHRAAILSFARSFELKDEIPRPYDSQ